MTIATDNIKLMASERLTDAPDGGGMMSPNEVIDNVENNLFPDVSELDRTYGRIALRKAFLLLDVANAETYYGANAIVADPPDDPRVHALLFAAGGYAGERAQAREHIEQYVVRGPQSPSWHLYGTHVEGQAQVRFFGRTDRPLPEIGDVMVLLEDEGTSEEIEQFVRITDVDYEDYIFTDGQGEYTRRVVTCDLGDPLRYDFHGPAINRQDDPEGSTNAFIYETAVADAARYYGAQPLSLAAEPGDLQLQVSDVYGQLVPSTRGEHSMGNQQAAMGATVTIDAGSRNVQISQVTQTGYIGIALANRALNYVFACRPLPAAGTVQVSYRALDRWYNLTDQGDGTLTGNGAGTVDYQTGTILVTLQALPDVDTLIVIQWGTPLSYRVRAGQTVGPVQIKHTCAEGHCERNTVTASWYAGGGQVSVSDDGDGNLSGTGGTGTVRYATGELTIAPSVMPDPSSELRVSYDYGSPITESWSGVVPELDGTIALQITQTPIHAGSFKLKFTASLTVPAEQERTLTVQTPEEEEQPDFELNIVA